MKYKGYGILISPTEGTILVSELGDNEKTTGVLEDAEAIAVLKDFIKDESAQSSLTPQELTAVNNFIAGTTKGVTKQ